MLLHLVQLQLHYHPVLIFLILLNRKEIQSQSQNTSIIKTNTIHDADSDSDDAVSSSDEVFFSDDGQRYNYNNYEFLDVARRRHPLVTRDVNYDHRKYSHTCGRTVRMKPNKKTKIVSLFHGEKQYLPGSKCEWNFYGSSSCSPEIACSTIDLRPSPNCEEEHLLILDGVKGWVKLCESSSALGTSWKPSKGNHLFVILKTGSSPTFTRLFKGIRCQVTCEEPDTEVTVIVQPPLTPVAVKTTQKVKPQKPIAVILQENTGLYKIATNCECGLSEPKAASSRITGGVSATPFEFPWMVAIVSKNTRIIICGGSLINSLFVLTAAHCFAAGGGRKTFNTTTMEAVVHAQNLRETDKDEASVRASVVHVICNPDYGDLVNYNNDYCILKLNQTLNIIQHTPICLPPFDLKRPDLDNKMLTASGWGKLGEFRQSAKNLQKVNVQVVPEKRCLELFGQNLLSNKMICAGFDEGGKDTCSGDSGGPLVQKLWERGGKTKMEQVGVVSWGAGCGRANSPGIYSYVPAVVMWIKKTALDGTWCQDGARS